MMSEELTSMLARLDATLNSLADSRERLGEVLGAALDELRQQIDTIEYVLETPLEEGPAAAASAATAATWQAPRYGDRIPARAALMHDL